MMEECRKETKQISMWSQIEFIHNLFKDYLTVIYIITCIILK